MTEQEVHQLLLLRAIDSEAAAGAALPWTAADADAAAAEARRQVGESASAEAFSIAWARAGLQRLGVPADGHAPREAAGGAAPLLARWARPGTGRVRLAGGLLVLATFMLGALGDAWASDGRIQLLSMPLLGLIAWNLLVYAGLLLVGACRWARRWTGRRAGRPSAQGTGHGGPLADNSPRRATGPAHWLHWLPWLAEPAGLRRVDDAWRRVRRRQFEGLEAIVGGLWQWRALVWLHLAAAGWALGMVASMYARGLVLDFRAGWGSTFLDAVQVHALLGWLLAPGLAWPGLGLPGVAEIAALRWVEQPQGGAAAPWIHRATISLLAIVVLPRLLFAAALAGRVRHHARRLSLRFDAAYFGRWMPQAALGARGRQPGRPVTVLPYNCSDSLAQRARIDAALHAHWGAGVAPRWAAMLALGAEDDLPAGLPDDLAPDAVVLMSLNATPERESHGELLRRLGRLWSGRGELRLVLDAAAFARRLEGQPDAARRLAGRVQAWEALAAEAGWPPPWVLSADTAVAGPSAGAAAQAQGSMGSVRP